MKHKFYICFLLLYFFITSNCISLEIIQDQKRILLHSSNDKLSYGLTHNLDDKYSFAFGTDFIFPQYFLTVDFNGITNRGYKSDVEDINTFTKGRYDEFAILGGTDINLYNYGNFNINIQPELGVTFLGEFGLEKAQNFTHKLNNYSFLILPYETFQNPVCPVINTEISFTYDIAPQIQLDFSSSFDNTIFYATHQSLQMNAYFGKNRSVCQLFAGYKFSQNIDKTQTHTIYEDYSKGLNFGFNLDVGLFQIEYIAYTPKKFGYGTVYLDLLGFNKKKWESTNVYLSTSITFYLDSMFQDLQFEYPLTSVDNLFITFNTRYLNGFKNNPNVQYIDYKMERNYKINNFGLKYEFEIPQINNFITPFIEASTGLSSFNIRKISNFNEESTTPYLNYGTKFFYNIEFTTGFDIFSEGFLDIGSCTYKLSFFAGTIILPGYKKATSFILQDSYRDSDWNMKLFEFRYGFSLKMGLDF